MEGASRACETRKEARLSRRRRSCARGSPWVRNESGASQTRYRSDFKRTWVRLGERGRRDRLGARRGESLFSQRHCQGQAFLNEKGLREQQENMKILSCSQQVRYIK